MMLSLKSKWYAKSTLKLMMLHSLFKNMTLGWWYESWSLMK